MEAFLVVLLVLLMDPVRWLVWIPSAWFVRNYLGALVTGIGANIVLSIVFGAGSNAASLIAGCIDSMVVVSIFYFWRKSLRQKKAQAAAVSQ